MTIPGWNTDTATGWTKATASDQGGQCVEMRPAGPGVEVRDSKDPDGPALRLTATGWTRWLAGARRGDLDHLAAPGPRH